MNKLLSAIAICCIVFLSACGGNGEQPIPPSAPTVSASATPAAGPDADGNYSSTITWQTTNATQLDISGYPPVSAAPGTGSQVVVLKETTNYQVRALGPGGEASVTVTIPINTIPGPPKPIPPAPVGLLIGYPAPSTLTLSWSPVVFNDDAGNPYPITYDVYIDGVLARSAATSPATFAGLTNGQSYSFTVVAVFTNVSGTRFESAISTAVIGVPASDIQTVTVTVSWTEVTTYTDGTTIATADIPRIVYTIYANTTGDVPWGIPLTSVTGTNTATFTMTVQAGVTYYFTGTASLDGAISAYAVPVTHVWTYPIP